MSALSGPLHNFLWHAWDWDLSKIVGCALLIVGFALWTKLTPSLKSMNYILGVALLFLALASPLDALSDEYLFSAHMLQHIVLLMTVPPLLILGLPEIGTRSLLAVPSIRRTEKVLNRPIFAWFLGNLFLWIWHVPILYDWAVQDERIHIFEHLTFLISATVFWWPVLAPTPESRLPLIPGIVYLFLAALSNMTLGIVLTFSNDPAYSSYSHPADSWKILNILRSEFHLDRLGDQTLGGVLMWVIGGTIFLGVILIQFYRWYGEADTRESLRAEER